MPCALFDRSGYWPGVRGHALEPRTMVDPGQSLHPCLALEAVPDPLPPGEPEHTRTPRGTRSQRTPQGNPPAHRRSPTPFSGLLLFPGYPHSYFSQGGFPSSREAAGCFIRARLHGAEPRAIKGRAVKFLIGVNCLGPRGQGGACQGCSWSRGVGRVLAGQSVTCDWLGLRGDGWVGQLAIYMRLELTRRV